MSASAITSSRKFAACPEPGLADAHPTSGIGQEARELLAERVHVVRVHVRGRVSPSVAAHTEATSRKPTLGEVAPPSGTVVQHLRCPLTTRVVRGLGAG